MVGNSLRSDIAPALGIGASAVHIPYAIEWKHETVAEKPRGNLVAIEKIGDLRSAIAGLDPTAGSSC